MFNLNLPFYPFKLKEINKKTHIFDEIRKKYLLLTPEEWVRQHVIQYLINEKAYPKTLIKVESGLLFNGMRRRSDILTLDHSGKPYLLVECKSPKSSVNERALEQAARYNYEYKARFVVLTNGLSIIACDIDHERKSTCILTEIPAYVRGG